MSQLAGYLLAVLLPPLAVAGSAVNSPPFGLLPACFTRRARWRYRKMRGARGKQKSGRVGRHLTAMVRRADRNRCVYCGAKRGELDHLGRKVVVQVDHMVPWKLGGLTAFWNCALLCRRCNVIKNVYWKSPSGKVYYRGGHRAPALASAIYAAECSVRFRPARWLRAYGLLPAW